MDATISGGEADEPPVAEVKENQTVCHSDLCVNEVKGEVDELRNELRQKAERLTALERERETLERCVRELEGEKRSCAHILCQTEEKMAEEREETLHSIITRLNGMEEKLATAQETCGVLKRHRHKTTLDNLQRVNFDLQTEVTKLKGVVKETDESMQPSDREALLATKEAELAALRQEAQEARRREVERRRELLAVAEEAIAQKEAELQKRDAEISRLKEELECSSGKLSSFSVDARRRQDEVCDLREKLADSKKQIQQVQKEICSMRDVEKGLRQKLSDVEKMRSQLQNELCTRDRTIQQLKSSRSSDSKSEEHTHRYEKALKDLQESQRVVEEMRLVLGEQEHTQTQMDLELENRETQIHQLTEELENLKELLLKQRNSNQLHHQEPSHSDDITRAKQEALQAQENLKRISEKHQAERRKWTEEKLVLIAQAKDAEERRNQDMRRYAEDRERHARQHTELELLKTRLSEREQEMNEWRTERDTLVSALEVQLKKLVSTMAEKDQQICALKRTDTLQPPEVCDNRVMEQLMEKEAELKLIRAKLQETTNTTTHTAESSTQTMPVEDTLESSAPKHTGRTRASVTSQGSCASGPSVLDSSVISTETGRSSRFPRPELEISFSSLHPERFRLKRPGDHGEITVNVTHTHNTRKRKSAEVARDGVESENRRNMRCKKSPSLAAHQEEEMSPVGLGKTSHDSQLSLKRKKEGKLQKIGDFLNSSPTFLGSKAKRIMGLMSGRSPDESSSSLNLKRSKRKINISSPMNISANQIISRDVEEREDQLSIKKRLRTKTPK